ncbi:MAG TPA: hypothetical protein VFU94_02450 [Conexibacter sp.]|nr:hypothetical protein [Conexibacter sp.]
MAYGDAQRKVLFYLARPTREGVEWDRDAVCAAINALRGADAYYDDGEQVNRAEVFADTRPHMIRFFKVRRDDLPGVDDGAGDRRDLALAEDAGLIEAIHICLFPNGVIGAEFFFYGPRMSRFDRFIGHKLGLGPFEIRELVRNDVIDQALRFGDIRLLRIKLNPSVASRDAVAGVRLSALMDTAVDLGAGLYADLTLRSEPGDDKFRERVKALLRRLKQGANDVHVFDKLEIAGKPAPGEPVLPLDILSERLHRMVEIPYRAERYRDLNSDAAFAAIRQAYREVADEIPRDGGG